MQISPSQVLPTQNWPAETVGVVHWYHPNDSNTLENCDRALGSIRSRRAERSASVQVSSSVHIFFISLVQIIISYLFILPPCTDEMQVYVLL